MSQLEILTLDQAAKSDLPWPDMYFTPEYGRIVERSDMAEWQIAVWRNGPILLPYLKRAVATDISPGNTYYDITSPYGYGGCWAPNDVPVTEWKAFRSAFRGELLSGGAVSEFLRLGGLVPGKDRLLAADPLVNMTPHNETVVLNVEQSCEDYWNACEGRARTAVRKARRLGYVGRVRLATEADLAAGSQFRTLYEVTMQRVDADHYYFFPDEYYADLMRGFPQRLVIFESLAADGEVVVAGLVVLWPPFLHLHLVGNDPDAARDGAGNLAYDAVIRWACEHPVITRFHLGGGLKSGDSLFRFKRSLGGFRIPYWVARSVIDRVGYQRLVAARAGQLGCPVATIEASGYFPAYRASLSNIRRAA